MPFSWSDFLSQLKTKENDQTMPQPTNYFEFIDGVPVHYDRFAPPFGYGSKGRPHRFYCTPDFEAKLDAAFGELFDICPLGKAEVITSAGAYVDKPGMHSLGRSFDLDGIFWRGKSFVTLVDGGPGDRRFYQSVEAVLRRHFGTILNYDYNAAHRDHLHMDDGSPVGFDAYSRSRVLFLQGALKCIFKKNISITGTYGPTTRQETENALEELNIPGSISSSATWRRFLLETARKGFNVPSVARDLNPLESLHNIYEELRNHDDYEGRKAIEAAVNLFVNHPETKEWLKRYR